MLGFSWQDLDDKDNGSAVPSWFDDRVPGQLMAQAGNVLKPSSVGLIRRGPLDLLLSWIQAPDVQGLAAVGGALPWFFAAVAQKQGRSGQRADLARTCVDILDGHDLAEDGVPVWTWRDDTLVVACRLNPKNETTEIAALLDDGPEAVGQDHRSAWQAWLRLANLLALRPARAVVTTRSRVASIDQAQPVGAPTSTADGALPMPWQALV